MRRTLVALSLTASLVTAPTGFFDRLLDLLSVFSEDPPPVHQPQSKAGCGWDPSGLCQPSAPPQTDAGCGADPSGQCNPDS